MRTIRLSIFALFVVGVCAALMYRRAGAPTQTTALSANFPPLAYHEGRARYPFRYDDSREARRRRWEATRPSMNAWYDEMEKQNAIPGTARDVE
jgi:hypothetical protein